MHRGYVKLHRSLADWEWYTEPNMVLFFVHCLIRANHKDGTWKGYDVKKGQFISGRKVLSAETGLSERNIRTCIEKLKKSGELTIKPTNKNTLFTLNNWEKYQSGDTADQQSANKRPKADQQTTTNKNVNNEKNVNNIEARELAFKQSLKEFSEKYPREVLVAFADYWTEPNKSKSKMKFETQTTWDLSRRIDRWASSNFNSPIAPPKPIYNQSHTFDPTQADRDLELLRRSGQLR